MQFELIDRFYLLIDSRDAHAELMAECRLCGALATRVLDPVSAEAVVVCSHCGFSMPLAREALETLREKATRAIAGIDDLLARDD